MSVTFSAVLEHIAPKIEKSLVGLQFQVGALFFLSGSKIDRIEVELGTSIVSGVCEKQRIEWWFSF